MITTAEMVLLREHGQRHHIAHPNRDCPACRKFVFRRLSLVPPPVGVAGRETNEKPA